MQEEHFNINYIKKQFLCCTPINKFKLIDSKYYQMSLDIQKKILDNTIYNILITNYPVKMSYRKAFLKMIINKLEQNCEEVHASIYSEYCNLISSHCEQPMTHYRHYLLNGKGILDCITLQESTNIISDGTTGLCSWQAALSLGEWCIANKELLNGKSILELGSGVGLTGLTAISICLPKEYTFSDYHPTVLKMLCRNVQTNFQSDIIAMSKEPELLNDKLKLEVEYNGICVRVIDLAWEKIDAHINENQTVPDVILAADVLYDSSAFCVLTRGLKSLLSKNKCYAVIAATVRNADTITQFFNQLVKYNLMYEEVTVPKPTIFIKSDDTPIQIIKIFIKE